MNAIQFDEFEKNLLAEVTAMSATKGKEYSGDKNRFENFNNLAIDLEIDRLAVAWVFTKKHLDAIRNFIRTGRCYSEETIRGRFVDAIKYLTLIAGMVEEDSTRRDAKLEMRSHIPEDHIPHEMWCKTCGMKIENNLYLSYSTQEGTIFYHPGCITTKYICVDCHYGLQDNEAIVMTGGFIRHVKCPNSTT